MAGMELEEKRRVIQQARLARREGLPEAANPYPADSEAAAVWLSFYRMQCSDALRDNLVHSEYEASAY